MGTLKRWKKINFRTTWKANKKLLLALRAALKRDIKWNWTQPRYWPMTTHVSKINCNGKTRVNEQREHQRQFEKGVRRGGQRVDSFRSCTATTTGRIDCCLRVARCMHPHPTAHTTNKVRSNSISEIEPRLRPVRRRIADALRTAMDVHPSLFV